MCHVHLGKNFTEIFFGMSKERVRSWSHAFLITNVITLGKKLLALRPEKKDEKEKKKKTRMEIPKLFALNANAINHRLFSFFIVIRNGKIWKHWSYLPKFQC